MQRRTFVAGSLLSLVSFRAWAASKGFVRLYNGKDLSGWHAEGGPLEQWTAEGETLSCAGTKGGYLAADQEYGDFELRLDYRLPPGGNSGIGIRFPRGGWPSTMGMEIQLLDDPAPEYANAKPDTLTGSIYTFTAPTAHPQKLAGQWNHAAVRCRGAIVEVWINDVQIQHVDVSTHKELGKGKVALCDRPRKGLVGLQSHTGRVDFKNVEIREL